MHALGLCHLSLHFTNQAPIISLQRFANLQDPAQSGTNSAGFKRITITRQQTCHHANRRDLPAELISESFSEETH
jgi:hypothetical protein